MKKIVRPRLDPAVVFELEQIRRRSPLRPSLTKLANLAITLALPKLWKTFQIQPMSQE